jgi:hypothetical protein
MRNKVFAQRYFDGLYQLRYLPLFDTINATLTPPRAACPSRFINPGQALSGEYRQSSESCYQLLIELF